MTDQALHCTASHAPSQRRFSAITWARAALSTYRSRQQLKALAPHQLEDIGVTPRQAATEQDKPLWDVPGHWLK